MRRARHSAERKSSWIRHEKAGLVPSPLRRRWLHQVTCGHRTRWIAYLAFSGRPPWRSMADMRRSGRARGGRCGLGRVRRRQRAAGRNGNEAGQGLTRTKPVASPARQATRRQLRRRRECRPAGCLGKAGKETAPGPAVGPRSGKAACSTRRRCDGASGRRAKRLRKLSARPGGRRGGPDRTERRRERRGNRCRSGQRRD